MVASQTATENFAATPGSRETVVHKWRLFRALTEAKEPLGVTERALSVLHALLSFRQETALSLPETGSKSAEAGAAGAGIVVFRSNKELSIRAHGMVPATLRRHLACLVEAGLIIRRDSPNGKRFARKGQGGAIEDAFGFDLAPLVARSSEIENLAEEVRAENRAIALLREKITLARRDIVKMIETGLEEGVSGDWDGAHQRYAALSGRYVRGLSRADLEALAGALAAEIHKSLHIKAKNMSGNESQTERHIQNQTNLQEGRADPSEPNLEQGREAIVRDVETSADRTGIVDPKPRLRTYPLGVVLEPVQTLSITARAAKSPPGEIWLLRRRSCARRSAFRRTPGRRPRTSWASMTPRSSSPRSCNAAMKSKALAVISAR